MDSQQHFGDLLKQFMEEKQRNDGALEKLSGVAKHTIVSWRQGRTKRPRFFADIIRLALALELTEEEANLLLDAAGHRTITAWLDDIPESEIPETLLPLLSYWQEKRPQIIVVEEEVSAEREEAIFQAPAQVAHFTGRTDIMDAVSNYLLDDGRIAILYGMGGVGKTAVATNLAYRLRPHCPDGVLWIDMRHIIPEDATADEKIRSILVGIVREFAPGFESSDDIQFLSSKLRDLLASKNLLLVLDNAESKIHLDYFLPPTLGDSKIIVTTRRRTIDRTDAQGFEISSLTENDGLALLQQLVGEERLAYQELGARRLGALLGYLPLALQIVGRDLAETTDITLNEYIELLEDESERLVEDWEDATRGVRATFELSHQRLTPAQQSCFASLVIFEGDDFSTGAVSHILEIPSLRAKTILSQLHRLSLLEKGRVDRDTFGERYQFHPLLHQFAREKLAAAGAIDQRFRVNAAHYFADLAHEYRFANFEILDLEWENILGALFWAMRHGLHQPVEQGINGLTALRMGVIGFLDSRAQWSVGVDFMEQMLSAGIIDPQTAVYGSFCMKLGAYAYRLADFTKAHDWLEKAITHLGQFPATAEAQLALCYGADYMARVALQREELEGVLDWSVKAVNTALSFTEADMEPEIGYANIRHAEILGRLRQYGEALTRVTDGLELLPDEPTAASATGRMTAGAIHYYSGNKAEALDHWQKGLKEAEQSGDLRRILGFRHNLALIASEKGDFKSAIPLQEEIIEASIKIGDVKNALVIISNVAEDYIFTCQYEQARAILTRGIKDAETFNVEDGLIRLRHILLQLELRLGHLTAAEQQVAILRRASNTLTFQEQQNEFLYHMADLARQKNDIPEAQRLLRTLLQNQKLSTLERGLALRLAGIVSAAAGLVADAQQAFTASLKILTELENRYALAVTQKEYGLFLLQQGDHTTGRAILQQACHYFADMEIGCEVEAIEQFL